MMEFNFLLAFYLVPLLSCFVLVVSKNLGELRISSISYYSVLLSLISSCYLFWLYFKNSFVPIDIPITSFSFIGSELTFQFWIDEVSVGFLFLTHILTLSVLSISKWYLNGEKGYQRFFSSLLLFIFGMQLLCVAGTLELFFAAWEIVGLSSFLLIAFYRSHNRSVLNAWRIFNIYRICDVGLLVGAVIGHHLFHESTHFSTIAGLTIENFSHIPAMPLLMISLFLLLASMGKSAQFPFYNWPARAMEGPTPSSAIFYGALSIHAGILLLLRTYNLWSHSQITTTLMFLIGLTTLVFSRIQKLVQSNIKGQIAYACTSHLGFMFILLALGFHKLVLIYVIVHALYRCLQILVSPSVVLLSLRGDQHVESNRFESGGYLTSLLPKRVKANLYVAAMNDFFCDISWRGFSFYPWRKAYYFLRLAMLRYPIFPILLFSGMLFFVTNHQWYLLVISFSLFLSIRSLIWNKAPFNAIFDISLSLFLLLFALYHFDRGLAPAILWYSVPVLPGLLIASSIAWKFRFFDIRNFHALGHQYPMRANLMFISLLFVSGMPFTTAFLAEDILLNHLISHDLTLSVIATLNFMMLSLVFMKVYTRLFMGTSMHKPN